MVALSLATAGLVAISTAPAQSAVGDSGSSSGSPVFATAGDGRFKDRIGWMSWGAENANLVNGATARSWQQTGPTERIEVTCTLSNRSGNVRAYRPGSFAADGLTRLYRTASGPALVSALGTNGASNSFRVGCNAQLVRYSTATFSGTPVATTAVQLAGLVFADAESTNANERIEITPTNGDSTIWRVIDRYPGTCSAVFRAQRSDHEPTWWFQTPDWRNRLTLSATGECGEPGNYSPTAVVFAEGGTQFDVSLVRTGEQALAIGYVLGADFGDAPASYGSAAALVQPTWTGGELNPKGTRRDVTGSGAISLAAIGAPALRLGPQAFTNMSVPHSAQADGDTGWGVPNPNGSITQTADEDAFTAANAPSAVTIVPGETVNHSVANVRCSEGTFVRGWIDWNRNGAFDSNEGSTPANGVQCPSGGGTVSLPFTIPAGVPDGVDPAGDLTFLRLQATSTRTQLSSATTTLVEGEVEDWLLRLRVPRLEVTKTADVSRVPAAGEVVTYTVTVTNTGNGDVATAYVYDAYAGVHDDAVVGAATSSAPGASGQDTTNHVLWWSGAIAAGGQVTFTIPFTMRAGDPGNLVLRNVARASISSLTVAQQTAACTGAEQTAGRCAVSDLYRVDVQVTKRAYLKSDTTFSSPLADGARLAPGTQVVWRYTVHNTGSIALSGIQLTDVATETKWESGDSTSVASSPTISCSGSPAVAPGTTVTIPTLAAGAQRVCQAEGVIGGT